MFSLATQKWWQTVTQKQEQALVGKGLEIAEGKHVAILQPEKSLSARWTDKHMGSPLVSHQKQNSSQPL